MAKSKSSPAKRVAAKPARSKSVAKRATPAPVKRLPVAAKAASGKSAGKTSVANKASPQPVAKTAIKAPNKTVGKAEQEARAKAHHDKSTREVTGSSTGTCRQAARCRRQVEAGHCHDRHAAAIKPAPAKPG